MSTLVEYLVVDAVIGDPGDAFFDGLVAAFADLAELGMVLEVIERDEQPTHVRLSWLDHFSGAAVRMWDDYRAMVRYLELRAPTPAAMSRLRSTLVEALRPPARSTLVQRARLAPADPVALMKVVYSAAELPDDDTTSIVRAALVHPNQTVRELAAYGAGILGWSAFMPPIVDRLTIETAPAVIEALERTRQLIVADPAR